MKKRLINLLMILVLCLIPFTSNAQEYYSDNNVISVDYLHTTEPRASISFGSNTINCLIHCSLNKADSTVRGTMVLRDNTDSKIIESWNVSGTGSLNVKKSASAIKGHSYTLSFTGTVKTSGGQLEQIRISMDKRFN